jgi:Zn-dependent protease with chaperone function
VDFFAHQEQARRATRWLLLAFLVSVALVALAVSWVAFAVFSLRGTPEQAMVPATLTAVVTLLIIGGASLFKTLSLRAGGGVVARSLGGTRVERGTRDPAHRRLHNIVEEMSIASGVTMPEVYVLENEDGINAFAAGHTPADAAVAVTRGALTRLKRDELQGVIAHEFSHVLNGDMRLNSKLLGWVFGLLIVAIAARLFLQGVSHGGRRDDGGGKAGALLLVALAILIVGYIGVFVGRLLQAAVSRHRERLADASAVQFTRNPDGLVGALLKIAGVKTGSALHSPDKEEVAHMLFAPGMRRLFATHPPLEERVRQLNPSLRTQDFPALAAAAAREGESLRLAPAFDADTPDVAVAAVAPLPVATAAAERVASLAGTFDETQQRYAHQARLAIPEALHAFADSPDAARVLLFALLLSAHEEVAARQDEAIQRTFGASLLARVHASLPVARSLPPELRLPAVQQLIPAVRRMTDVECRELRAVTAQLALADDRIDVFEASLTLLLEDALDATLQEHGTRALTDFAPEVSALFAVLAQQGVDDPQVAQRAYEAGMKHTLPHHGRPFAPVTRWPEALRQSLRSLARLRPFAKKVLIEGLVRTVAHDRRLSVPEGELLRTVCAVLHCPLPPILDAASRRDDRLDAASPPR